MSKPINLQKRREERQGPQMDLANLSPYEHQLLNAIRKVIDAGVALDKVLGHEGFRNSRDRLNHEENFYYDELLNQLSTKSSKNIK